MTKDKSGHIARIVFDITDGVVSVGAGYCGEGGSGVVWSNTIPYATVRALVPVEKCKRLCAALLDASSEAVREGVTSLSRHGMDFRHGEIVCVLGLPWSFANASFVSHATKERKSVEHGLLDTLRADAYKSMLSSEPFQAWTERYGSTTIMQQYDQEIVLEGYSVPRVRGHQACVVAMRTFLFLAASECVEKVRAILADAFPHHRIVFHNPTYLFSHTGAVRPLDLTERAVFLEIGHRHTSVGFVRGGTVLGVATVRSGITDLIHSIAPGAANFTEAQSRAVSMVRSGSPISKESESVLTNWRTAVFERITEIMDGVVPPLSAIIAVESPWYRYYAESLSAEPIWRTEHVESRIVTAPLYEDIRKGAETETNELAISERMSNLFTAVDKFARQS